MGIFTELGPVTSENAENILIWNYQHLAGKGCVEEETFDLNLISAGLFFSPSFPL